MRALLRASPTRGRRPDLLLAARRAVQVARHGRRGAAPARPGPAAAGGRRRRQSADRGRRCFILLCCCWSSRKGKTSRKFALLCQISKGAKGCKSVRSATSKYSFNIHKRLFPSFSF